MYKDVEQYVKTCHECQLNKQQPTSKPAGIGQVLPIPQRPWESIAMDFVGPLTRSNGSEYVFVIVDRFSSSVICYPLPHNFSAITVADVFIQKYYGRYGLPKSIVSDRDSRFTGKFWQSA